MKTAGLIWTRATRPSRTARPTLDRDAVVDGAIEILDTDGVDGLSMRKLAATLGATAPTLYWHVSSKDELLDLAFDEVMRDLPDVRAAGGDDWRADAELDNAFCMLSDHVVGSTAIQLSYDGWLTSPPADIGPHMRTCATPFAPTRLTLGTSTVT